MSKSVYKCRKKYPRLPLNRLDSTLHNSARYDTPLTLRHSCQLFRTTFSRTECWNFPSDSYLQWYFLLLVSEVVTYLAQNRQLSSMIDISVFVWGTVRLAVRITERSFRSVDSFPAPVAVDALPAAGKPSPSLLLHLLVASLLLPPLLFLPPPLPLPLPPLSSVHHFRYNHFELYISFSPSVFTFQPALLFNLCFYNLFILYNMYLCQSEYSYLAPFRLCTEVDSPKRCIKIWLSSVNISSSSLYCSAFLLFSSN